uniref:Double oxidase: two peroxidase domains n=1 Tax=Daphnia galeata TaxID=27404 RepID=A0A8J2WP40_9CRUS|nr:unnamed protein product [Daphnia galeata]
MAPKEMRYCFPLAQFLVVIWLLSCACHAVHFESGFTDKLIIDALQQSVRTRRDTLVKHKTQHLKPAIEIEPINEKIRVAMPHFNVQDLTTYATQAATAIAARFDEFEPTLLASNDSRLQTSSAAWFMAASHKTKVVAKNISRIALMAEETTKYFAQGLKLTKEQITFALPTMDVRNTVLADQCPLEVDFPCQPRKYRAYNGYCNNVQNPRWGNANTRYLRFLPPDYSDGVSIPRQANDGTFLPSARDISLAVHKDVDNPHLHLTAMAAIWGQLVHNDISHTPQMAGFLGQRLRCCGVNLHEFHPECYPIRLPDSDPVNGQINIKCQEYVRSGTAPRVGCTLGPREQINQVTSFIDGSTIYGSSVEEANDLRLFRAGLMKTQPGPTGTTKGLLPPDDNIIDCNTKNKDVKCFKAGDVRVNEHTELTALHVILIREHNRLAEELAVINSHWSDETLFQEARRIVGAEMQHITYSEFLPVILGQTIMEKYGLEPESSGYFTGYDININPGVANSVAASALRFVASLLPKKMGLYRNGRKISEQKMGSSFYAPFELYEQNGLDEIIEGLARTLSQSEDPSINDVMTNHMFQEKPGTAGLDLAAQIIQHGRDHGIPGYIKWREFCGLPSVTTFDQLSDVMNGATIATLKSIYRHINDIDLFTGGLAETPNAGAVVGRTLGCLIGRQFHYLRRGDRYWYENELPPSSFTKDQLHAIRKVSLARLICDNSDSIDQIQPRVFLINDPFLNADMSCHDGVIPKMDLGAWKTASPHFVIPETLLEESVVRAKREAEDYLTLEETLQLTAAAAAASTRPKRQISHFNPITNLSAWTRTANHNTDKTTNYLTLHTLVTPAPLHRRRMSPQTILTTINPSLRAWLAPLIFPRLRTGHHDYPNNYDYSAGGFADRQSFNVPQLHGQVLNQYNLDQHLLNLLLANYDESDVETEYYGPRKREAVDVLQDSARVAHQVNGLLADYESQRKGADPKSPVGTAFSFSRPKRQASAIANISRVLQFASKRFVNSFLNLVNQKDVESQPQPSTLQELMKVLPNIDVSEVVDIPKVFQCDEQTLPCDHTSKYRTMTGWCNNLNFPELGKSLRAFIRLLPPKYEDGLSTMRATAVSGRPLPSARMISANIHNDVSAPHTRYSLMVMQYAQMLDHDLTFTPVNRGFGGSIIDCNSCDSAKTVHPECAPISVPPNDPWFPHIERSTGRPKCIPFTRSLPGQLTLGHREQLNQVTAFVDGSSTYGSDVCEMRKLRAFVGGRLNSTRHPIRGKDLLPLTGEHLECKSPSGVCFTGGYDATCNPTIFTEFSSAAFRFGHSLLKEQFKRMGANFVDRKQNVKLRDVFMNPDIIYQVGMIDDLMRGMLGTSMETMDQFITHEVTNHLFEEKAKPFSGLDLAALNIQRARDHGIRPYNDYRALCNLKRARTFEDLSREVTPEIITRLKQTYEHVDDIDLFPGGLAETSLHGGLVGPTFACIIAMQFRQLRKCDRFWYENGDPLIRFTEAQLAEIRKATVSKLICDNSDGIDTTQRSAFDQSEPFLNPRVSCRSLPSIDLELWKERVSCTVGSTNIEVGKADRISPCVMCTCTREGPICQSLKVVNCFQLAQTFSPAAILNDHVCKVQCAFAFRAFPQVAAAQDPNQLGFS